MAEVRLRADGRVERLAQRVQACAFGQASAALVQQLAVGLSVHELKDERQELAAWLAGEGEPPAAFAVLTPARSKTGRHGAILLPFDAVIGAMEQAAAPLDIAQDERSKCGGGAAT